MWGYFDISLSYQELQINKRKASATVATREGIILRAFILIGIFVFPCRFPCLPERVSRWERKNPNWTPWNTVSPTPKIHWWIWSFIGSFYEPTSGGWTYIQRSRCVGLGHTGGWTITPYSGGYFTLGWGRVQCGGGHRGIHCGWSSRGWGWGELLPHGVRMADLSRLDGGDAHVAIDLLQYQ